jgi:hypothetical protein
MNFERSSLYLRRAYYKAERRGFIGAEKSTVLNLPEICHFLMSALEFPRN